MGLFNFFKKPFILEDDFFGTLRFRKSKNPDKSYFEGNSLFKPTRKKLNLTIYGNESGPEQKQKDFYQKIQENYRELVTKLTPLLEEVFNNWREGFKVQNFDKEFELVGVTIPSPTKTTSEWDMSYNTIHDENHQFTVRFIGLEPQEVFIDG